MSGPVRAGVGVEEEEEPEVVGEFDTVVVVGVFAVAEEVGGVAECEEELEEGFEGDPNSFVIISSVGAIWLRWIMESVPLCIGEPDTPNRDMGGSSNSHSSNIEEYGWILYPVCAECSVVWCGVL